MLHFSDLKCHLKGSSYLRFGNESQPRPGHDYLRKTVNSELDGSYLHAGKETDNNLTSLIEPSISSNSNEAIMAILHEIKESNAALARKMDKVEGNNSIPINPRSRTVGHPPVSP